MSVLPTVSEDTRAATKNQNSDSPRRRSHRQPPTPPEQSTVHTGGSLTRVTANFTPRAMASLDRVTEKTGDSRTDVLNIAVMAYETLLELIEEGDPDRKSLKVVLANGEIQVLRFIG